MLIYGIERSSAEQADCHYNWIHSQHVSRTDTMIKHKLAKHLSIDDWTTTCVSLSIENYLGALVKREATISIDYRMQTVVPCLQHVHDMKRRIVEIGTSSIR